MNDPDPFRPWHYIRPNRGRSVPQHMIFLDTESRWESVAGASRPTQRHTLRLGCATYVRFRDGRVSHEDHIVFTTHDQFWTWVDGKLSPKRPLWLFAHNLGFDLTMVGFWAELDRGAYRLHDPSWPIRSITSRENHEPRPWRGLCVLEDPPTFLSVRRGRSTLWLVDTLNYWPCTLAQLGESVGFPKLPMPPADAPDTDWITYCGRDVSILREAVVHLAEWWVRGQYGQWRATAAGLAWSAYRHRFMPAKILVHGHRQAIRLERDSYFGGECRCFFVGRVRPDDYDVTDPLDPHPAGAMAVRRGPIYHLDVRSMYPALMRSRLYPSRLTGWHDSLTLSQLRSLLHDGGAIAHVQIRTDTVTFPVRTTDGVRHCVGHYWTTLAWPELWLALELELICRVGECATYELSNLFGDYVRHFWLERAAAEGANLQHTASLCKMLLNSLYGKFGQRSRRWDDDANTPSPIPWGHWHRLPANRGVPQTYRAIAWHTQRQNASGEAGDSCPAIASYVTSYGRVLMYRLRQIAGAGNVLYQDTDSLHVTESGYQRLRAHSEVDTGCLGTLRTVGMACHADYWAPKCYRWDDQYVVSGVKRSAKMVDRNTWQQESWQGVVSVLSTPERDHVDVATVRVSHPGLLRFGEVAADGTVYPPSLECPDEQ